MKIGLLVGMEDTFPRAVLERIAERADDVEAEYVVLEGTGLEELSSYDVILDRMSHEVAFYRSHVRHARLSGTRVINDPFLAAGDDRFFDAAFASRLGVSVPKTILLPQKGYPDTVTPASLRNLAWPIPFERHLETVGTPAVLRPVGPRGWRHATRVSSLDELMVAYDRTGGEPMMLQEAVPWSRYVRCIVVGGDQVIIARYDPEYRQYLEDPAYLGPKLEERIVRDAAAVATGLGYDICAIEFAIVDEEPFAVEFVNPVPDFERSILTPFWFEKVVEAVACHTIALARLGKESFDLKKPKGNGLIASIADLPAAAPKKTAKRKAAARKPAAKKKAAARKPAAKKKAAARKPAAKKKAAVGKPAAKKKAAVRKPAAKKKAAVRKPAAKKKPVRKKR